VTRQDTPFRRSPSEHRRIVSAAQSRVLNAHDIHCGIAPQQTAQDVIVEVLVEGEPNHLALSDRLARRASRRDRIPSGPDRRSFSVRTVARCFARAARYAATSD